MTVPDVSVFYMSLSSQTHRRSSVSIKNHFNTVTGGDSED